MTTSLYIQCIAMFILGQAFDLMFSKIPENRKLFVKANEQFSLKKYWASDWNIIVGAFAVGIMLIIGLDQLIKWKPGVLDYVKWFFAGVGALCSIIAGRWSNCKKYISDIIDRKTNIADSVTNNG